MKPLIAIDIDDTLADLTGAVAKRYDIEPGEWWRPDWSGLRELIGEHHFDELLNWTFLKNADFYAELAPKPEGIRLANLLATQCDVAFFTRRQSALFQGVTIRWLEAYLEVMPPRGSVQFDIAPGRKHAPGRTIVGHRKIGALIDDDPVEIVNALSHNVPAWQMPSPTQPQLGEVPTVEAILEAVL